MPFNPFPPNTPLPPPIVEVLFKGLIILRPNNNGTCTVGMHRYTDDHFLIIEVRGKPPTGRDFLVLRRTGLLGRQLSIGLSPSPGTGVSAFQPEGANFRRATSSDGRDLRWAIDLRDPKDFYATALEMHADAEPGILMTDGVFFSADITDERELGIKRTRGGDTIDLRRIATIVGAIISPPAGSSVVLNDGVMPDLSLPRSGDPPGTTYRVSVRNDPVAIDFVPTHDELELYFDLVRKPGGVAIPPNEQYSLEVSPHGIHGRNTDRIPCMPILLGG